MADRLNTNASPEKPRSAPRGHEYGPANPPSEAALQPTASADETEKRIIIALSRSQYMDNISKSWRPEGELTQDMVYEFKQAQFEERHLFKKGQFARIHCRKGYEKDDGVVPDELEQGMRDYEGSVELAELKKRNADGIKKQRTAAGVNKPATQTSNPSQSSDAQTLPAFHTSSFQISSTPANPTISYRPSTAGNLLDQPVQSRTQGAEVNQPTNATINTVSTIPADSEKEMSGPLANHPGTTPATVLSQAQIESASTEHKFVLSALIRLMLQKEDYDPANTISISPYSQYVYENVDNVMSYTLDGITHTPTPKQAICICYKMESGEDVPDHITAAHKTNFESLFVRFVNDNGKQGRPILIKDLVKVCAKHPLVDKRPNYENEANRLLCDPKAELLKRYEACAELALEHAPHLYGADSASMMLFWLVNTRVVNGAAKLLKPHDVDIVREEVKYRMHGMIEELLGVMQGGEYEEITMKKDKYTVAKVLEEVGRSMQARLVRLSKPE